MDIPNKLSIRVANSDDFLNLGNFRVKEFKDNKEYIVKDDNLLRKQNGFIYIIEGIENGVKEIVGTMQIELIMSPIMFNERYGSSYGVELDAQHFPTFYISKVATKKTLRNIGLNSYLRLQVLKVALKESQIRTLTGIVFEGSPRVQLMMKIGYQSKGVVFKESSYVSPVAQPYFVWLERKSFESASHLLESEIGSMSYNFDLQIELFNFKF